MIRWGEFWVALGLLIGGSGVGVSVAQQERANPFSLFYQQAQQGEYAAAVATAEQLLPLLKQQLGEHHPDTLAFRLQALQMALLSESRSIDEPLQQLQQLIELLQQQQQPELQLEAMQFYADISWQRQRVEEARQGYRALTEWLLTRQPPSKELLYANLWREGEVLLQSVVPQQATERWESVCEQLEPTISCQLEYGQWLLQQQQLAPLESLLQQLESLSAWEQEPLRQYQLLQARYWRSVGELAAAEPLLQAIVSGTEPMASETILHGWLEWLEVVLAQGRLESATELVAELLPLAGALPEPLSHWEPRLADNLGQYYQQLGAFEPAESFYRLAYQRYTEQQGEGAPATLSSGNNLALLLEEAGLYDEAEPLLSQGLLLARQSLGDEHPTTLAYMNNLAMLYESQGKFTDAEALYQSSIATLEESLGGEHDQTLIRINNLAYLHLLQGHNRLAADLFGQIYAQWQVTLGESHPNTLKALNSWGRALFGVGESALAAQKLQLALQGRQQQLGAGHRDTIRSRIDLLRLQQQLDAEPLVALTEQLQLDCEQSLSEGHPYCFEALGLRIETLTAAGLIDAAATWHQIRYQRRNQFLERMLWVTGENSREGYIRRHRAELDSYYTFLLDYQRPDAATQLLQMSLDRKGLLLAISAQIQQAGRFSNNPELASRVARLIQARKDLASLTLSGPQGMADQQHLQLLEELEVEIQRLEAELGRFSRLWAERAEPPQLVQLWQQLPPETVLIDYTLYYRAQEAYLVAVVVRRDEDGTIDSQWVDLGRYQPIAEAVVAFRTTIQDVDAYDDEILDAGYRLYRQIWQPLEPLLVGTEASYIVPDGQLNILPFAAINDAEDRYLIQKYNLTLLTSLRDLLPDEPQRRELDMLILAGPDYNAGSELSEAQVEQQRQQRNRAIASRSLGSRAATLESSRSLMRSLRGLSRGMRGLQFTPLPGAESEGELINEQFSRGVGEVTLYTGAEASEAKLQGLSRSPAILHLATHGFFLKIDEAIRERVVTTQRGGGISSPPPGDNPLLRAGLAFAGVNHNAPFLGELNTDNDGILTALEVLNLPLEGTELAVLSACETGLGEIHEGEGVYGLRRSFLEAGTDSLITSLWEVSDAGTQALMSRFYELVFEGREVHQAFRQTQLEMIDSYRWGYPYIWSAFMMTGL
ncbi:CHAT domain-containing protein [Ectothiorhodospiraceae bacterium BW-2]|nr:CHAT domain-containing protein [Ectothiorhodospiraceae bacterium BW-2]